MGNGYCNKYREWCFAAEIFSKKCFLIYPLVNATVFLRRQNSPKEKEHNKHNDVYLREKVF